MDKPRWEQCSPQLNSRLTLSIVSVTRKDPAGLRTTIASLLRDPWPADCELLVFEGDFVSDARYDSIRQELVLSNVNYRWCTAPDSGIYDAMNRGLIASLGEWVWFLNGGDCLDDDSSLISLCRDLQALSDDRLWAIGSLSDGQWPTPVFENVRVGEGGTICHQTIVARREALAVAGGFDDTYTIAADYKQVLRLASWSRPVDLANFRVRYEGGGLSDSRRSTLSLECARARSEVLVRTRTATITDYCRSAARAVRLMFSQAGRKRSNAQRAL